MDQKKIRPETEGKKVKSRVVIVGRDGAEEVGGRFNSQPPRRKTYEKEDRTQEETEGKT